MATKKKKKNVREMDYTLVHDPYDRGGDSW